MSVLNVVICDDNERDRELCKSLVERYGARTGHEFLYRLFEKGEELLFWAEDLLREIDLIFLDIHMPGMDGIETVKKLRKTGLDASVIFYTVSDEYAILGYDLGIANYVVKGRTTIERFEAILDRAVSEKEDREQEVIVLNCAGQNRCIALSDIHYFEIRQRIMTVHYRDETFDFYSTMTRLEEELFGKGFVRVHKSFLVAEREIVRATLREVMLRDGSVLPAGQKYISRLRKSREE